MLVPGRCWTSALNNLGNDPRFGLLGPFRRGQLLDRIVFGLSVSSSSQLTFGAVVGLAGFATVEAWAAGQPLVDRSNLVGDGQPVIAEHSFSNMGMVWPLLIGRRVVEGPAYVVWRAHRIGGTGALNAYATVQVLEDGGVVDKDGSVR